MKKPFCSIAICFVLLSSFLLVAPSFAQVPQDTTYTGRLVGSLGNPLAGPVNLELRVFDAETAGTELYSEQHLGTVLDVTGGFSVQLGLGTSPVGTFDAELFSNVNRWLEVVADTDVLTPRQIIGAVPWALVAQQANEIVPDPNAPRFEDCGDGTVADHDTGLQWEQKTDDGSVHDKDYQYDWSTGSPWDPDGTAFTDFLARLNGEYNPGAGSGCFAGRCDWRLPKISEHQTILVGPGAAPGQATTCGSAPCIDPDFTAVGGPTAFTHYWSASTSSSASDWAHTARFNIGSVSLQYKGNDFYVRAVRAGSCN